jgi:hypothetical protein
MNNFSLGAFANSNILSDDRKIGINEASYSSAAFFLKWLPLTGAYLSPFLGYTNNRQIGESDFGYLYGTELFSEHKFFEDIDLRTYFKYLNEDILPRRNLTRNLDIKLANNFNEYSQNTITAAYSLLSKDFYFLADSVTQKEFHVLNNLQTRAESYYYLQDRLTLDNISKGFGLNLRGQAAFRKISRDTRYHSLKNISTSLFDVDVQEFRLEFETAANFSFPWIDASLILLYQERDEKHITKRITGTDVFSGSELSKVYDEKANIEGQKNNNSLNASVSLHGDSKISDSDILSFNIIQSKLKYDTPSKLNFDDRDELLSFAKLEYRRKINSLFDLFLNLEGSLHHTVYLFAERSSNNNIRRVIRFGPGGYYHGKNFTTKNTFEVSANYTVYDFQNITSNNRSFSFRQSLFQDSTILKINRNLTFNFTGYLKYSEQGEFIWESFSGKPIKDLREIYFEPKIYVTRNYFSFGVGLRYFDLTSFSYSAKIRKMESDYKSVGPVSEINVKFKQRLNLRIYGYYEFINYALNKREMVNVILQMDWAL